LKVWFSGVLIYAENTRFKTKIISHENKILDLDTLISQYYPNPEDYFDGPQSETSVLPVYYSEAAHPVRLNVVTKIGRGISPELNSKDKSTLQFLKCSECDFTNIYQDEIDHHFKYTHQS
jgi:uncharacterized UBP type Zn finger protein